MERTAVELLWDLGMPAIAALMEVVGHDAQRARQVFRWLHLRGVSDPVKMHDLPKPLRTWLAERYAPIALSLNGKHTSRDGSIKYAWRTVQGHPVETVLLPPLPGASGFVSHHPQARSYVALSLSCQSGCSYNCKYCATGRMGLRQSLSMGQILSQMYLIEEDSGLQVGRLLFKGMGEPLRNFTAVHDAILILTNVHGRAWPADRIAVFTVGPENSIQTAAEELPPVNLRISLNFTTEQDRVEHMPFAEPSLARLAAALNHYRRVNGGNLAVEYTLFDGLNDSDADARRLANFARLSLAADSGSAHHAQADAARDNLQPLPLPVNLVMFNQFDPEDPVYQPASSERIDQFAGLLRDLGIYVSVRRSRGRDISAACGMLGARPQK